MAISTPTPILTEGSIDRPALVMNKLRELAVQALTNAVTGEQNATTVHALGSWLASARWYMVGSAEAAAVEWQKAASNPALVDFLLEYTHSLMFHLHAWGLREEVIVWTAQAYGASQMNDSVIHTHLLTKLPNQDALRTLYASNPWLMATVLLHQSGIVGELVKRVTRPG
jgi:hypothetical protein